MRSCNIFSRSLRGSALETGLFLARADEAFAGVLRADDVLRAADPPRAGADFTAVLRVAVALTALLEDTTFFAGAFLEARPLETGLFFDAGAFEAALFFDAGAFDAALLDAVLFDPTAFDATRFDAGPFNATPLDAAAFDPALFNAEPFVAGDFDAAAFLAMLLEATPFGAALEPAPALRDDAPRAGTAAFLDAPFDAGDPVPVLRLLPLEGAGDFLPAVDLEAAPPRLFEVAIVLVADINWVRK